MRCSFKSAISLISENRGSHLTRTTINIRWEATQRVMAVELTGLNQKIGTKLHLVAESCTICSSRSRRPVRNLFVTPSYWVGLRAGLDPMAKWKNPSPCRLSNPSRPDWLSYPGSPMILKSRRQNCINEYGQFRIATLVWMCDVRRNI
jgi:hypothetical protein